MSIKSKFIALFAILALSFTVAAGCEEKAPEDGPDENELKDEKDLKEDDMGQDLEELEVVV